MSAAEPGIYSDAMQGVMAENKKTTANIAGRGVSMSMLAERVMESFKAVLGNDADGELMNMPRYRDLAYQLYYANEIATAVVDTHATNVVGTGLKLKMDMNRTVLVGELGMSEDQVDEIEDGVETDYRTWSENPDHCDVDGEKTVIEQSDLAIRTRMIGGDAPILLTRRDARRVRRNGYLTQLQSISPRKLRNPQDRMDTSMLRGGIERNGQGGIRYHFSKSDPNSNVWDPDGMDQWFPPINKLTRQGRQNVILLKKNLEPGQSRGRPILVVIAKLIGRIGKFTDAQVMAAIKHAYMSLYMEGSPDDFNYGDDDEDAEEKKNGNVELKDGNVAFGDMIPHLLSPQQPGPHLEQFYAQCFKLAGMATGIPAEILVMHFSTSYTAARGVRVEYDKRIGVDRYGLRTHMLNPTLCTFLFDRVQQGALDLQGFMEDDKIRAAYCNAWWLNPPTGSIDKNREWAPEIALVQSNLKAGETVSEELTGQPYSATVRAIARTGRALEKAGIDPASLTPNLTEVADRMREQAAQDAANDAAAEAEANQNDNNSATQPNQPEKEDD